MTPVVALALAVASPVPGVEVAWHGDARCPEQGFLDTLARHLAGAPAARSAVRVAVTLRDEHGRWTAALVMEAAGARRERALHGRTCAEVRDAAAFVTAVVVDPGVLTRPAAELVPPPDLSPEPALERPPEPGAAPSPDPTDMSPEPAPARAPEPPRVPPPPSPPPAPAAPVPEDLPLGTARRPAPAPAPRRPTGFVRLAGGLEALGLPHVGPLVALAGGLRGPRWRIEATALYRAPTTRDLVAVPDVGARVRLWTLGARGCGVPRARRLELPLCAGLEVGQLLGAGVGFAGARRDSILWLAAVFAPALAWTPRPRLALWLGGELALPLLRGTFSAAGLGPLFEIAPVSLRLTAGLELRFGRRPTDPR